MYEWQFHQHLCAAYTVILLEGYLRNATKSHILRLETDLFPVENSERRNWYAVLYLKRAAFLVVVDLVVEVGLLECKRVAMDNLLHFVPLLRTKTILALDHVAKLYALLGVSSGPVFGTG